jgi:DNA-binding IclR family transcriptional regulator
MSRSSPGVGRVVAVLNFFADHPGQAFTLTDLVRALKLSRATCHGLLAGLVEAGYLYRTSDKTYLLGPALLALGEISKAHFSPLQAAQPEMRALADEYDAVCSAAFRERTDVVVRERAAAVSHLGYSVPRGTRLPLYPQFAGIFFVWSPPAEIKTWLDAVEPPPSEAARATMRDAIAFARTHGFLFSLYNTGSLKDALPGLAHYGQHQVEAHILPCFDFDLDPGQDYKLSSVQAPVIDAGRNVAFVIALQGFTKTYSGAEILAIGDRVRAAADRISAFMGRPSSS